jgi:hypothetical protein
MVVMLFRNIDPASVEREEQPDSPFPVLAYIPDVVVYVRNRYRFERAVSIQSFDLLNIWFASPKTTKT